MERWNSQMPESQCGNFVMDTDLNKEPVQPFRKRRNALTFLFAEDKSGSIALNLQLIPLQDKQNNEEEKV